MRLVGRCILVAVFMASTVGSGCKGNHDSTAETETKVSAKTALADIKGLNPSMGRVTGKVILEGARPTPQKLMVVKDVEVCGKQTQFDQRLVTGKGQGIQNAVISLVGVNAGNHVTLPEAEYILDQSGCDYRPHVLILPVNTPLQILNNDGILHNIHTYGKRNKSVNIAQPQFKKKLQMLFSEPEPVGVRCDIHGWMSAWIIVSEHPYYSLTDADGNFTIDNVPSGTYQVKCWQELLGEQTLEVKVEAGTPASLVFRYSQ